MCFQPSLRNFHISVIKCKIKLGAEHDIHFLKTKAVRERHLRFWQGHFAFLWAAQRCNPNPSLVTLFSGHGFEVQWRRAALERRELWLVCSRSSWADVIKHGKWLLRLKVRARWREEAGARHPGLLIGCPWTSNCYCLSFSSGNKKILYVTLIGTFVSWLTDSQLAGRYF